MEAHSSADSVYGRETARLFARRAIEVGIGLSALIAGVLFGAAFCIGDFLRGEVGRGVTLVIVEAVVVSSTAWFVWDQRRGRRMDVRSAFKVVISHFIIAMLVAFVFEISPSLSLAWLCASIAVHNVYLVFSAVETGVALSKCLSGPLSFALAASALMVSKAFAYTFVVGAIYMTPGLLVIVGTAGLFVLAAYRAIVVPTRAAAGPSFVHLVTDIDACAGITCTLAVFCGFHVR